MIFAILWIALPGFIFSQTEPSNQAEEAEFAAPAADRAAEREFVFDYTGSPAASGSAVPGILRMVLVLALVAAVIYFVIFFLKKMSRPQTEQNPHLKILATTHLGSGRFVHVVSVGKQAWLVGAGEGGVRHIAGIGDQEEIDAMLLEASNKSAEDSGKVFSFKTLLQRFSSPAAPSSDRLENIRKRREHFKRF